MRGARIVPGVVAIAAGFCALAPAAPLGDGSSSPPPADDPGAGPLSPVLRRLARVAVPGAEIVDYDPVTNALFVCAGPQVVMVHAGAGDEPVIVRRLDAARAAGLPPGSAAEASHLAVDPKRRGFLAVTVLPAARQSLPGRVVFVSTRTFEPLNALWAGFQPDSCAFAPDGAHLLVANEGESAPQGAGFSDPPGSVSRIDLAGVEGERDLARLAQECVSTVFVPADLAGAEHVRVHPRNARALPQDLEPESMALGGGLAWVTFQENDAVGVFEPATSSWLRLQRLPPLAIRADADDRDGIAIDDEILALCLPDQIAVADALGGGAPRRVLHCARRATTAATWARRTRRSRTARVSPTCARRDASIPACRRRSTASTSPPSTATTTATVASSGRSHWAHALSSSSTRRRWSSWVTRVRSSRSRSRARRARMPPLSTSAPTTPGPSRRACASRGSTIARSRS